MTKNKCVLIISSHYPPNIGGVESHLHSLVETLIKNTWKVIVSTYQPLASDKKGKIIEKQKSLTIYRMPWIGSNIFHKLAKMPFFEFLFLFPGLMLSTFFVILKNNKNISVIHAQGLVPAVIGIICAKLFRKRLVTSIHNLYFFPTFGLYPKVSKLIFQMSDKVLVPTSVAKKELMKIGVNNKKIGKFNYWLPLEKFKPIEKPEAKRKLKWKGFTVFFVGRLIDTKGVGLIMDMVDKINIDINIVIVGDGILKDQIVKFSKAHRRCTYLGRIENTSLPLYYSASDLTIVPSLVDEGWGYVAMESISCGTPVIASDVGGLSDVVAPEVGKLVNKTPEDFYNAIKYFYNNRKYLHKFTNNTREYAEKHFGDSSIKFIINAYEGKY